jgi:hypothetical protein
LQPLIPLLPIVLPLVAIAVSFSALAVAVLNYRRKSSQRIRGSFGLATSIHGEDEYISSVTIENLKDRAVTIFGIYLRVGYHHYIEIERFENKPLILKAYETWHNEYGPIDFYAANTRKINMNNLLSDRAFKKQLVLSTGDGRYVIKKGPKRWNPVVQYFKNYLTVPARPVRSVYKSKTLGGNAKYVVDLVGSDGEPVIIPIYRNDDTRRTFRDFNLTKDSLESAEALTKYLQDQKQLGKLICRSFEVVDVDSVRKKNQGFEYGEVKNVKAYGFFVYYILGPLVTYYQNRMTSKKNKIEKAKVLDAAGPDESTDT